jgi:hypothetical protein
LNRLNGISSAIPARPALPVVFLTFFTPSRGRTGSYRYSRLVQELFGKRICNSRGRWQRDHSIGV